MHRRIWMILLFICLFHYSFAEPNLTDNRVSVKAIGIPLADHYPGIVALEKYGPQMRKADFQFEILAGPELVRAYFMYENDADIAFNVSPMVIDMFIEKPDFKWVSLIHRDGNALAVNSLIDKKLDLPAKRAKRKPNEFVAQAFIDYKLRTGNPVECAIPSPLATHTVILAKYLQTNGLTFAFDRREDPDVLLKVVKPPQAMGFIKKRAVRNIPAAFEQSLPWAEIVETEHFGKVVWYSKDVMRHPKGHVECVIIAKNRSIMEKQDALAEVLYYIHRAGIDIELARRGSQQALSEIVRMIRKHIPQHTEESIIQSLREDLNVINYYNLNVDENSKWSFKQIMNLSFETGLIKRLVDIEELADDRFNSKITRFE